MGDEKQIRQAVRSRQQELFFNQPAGKSTSANWLV